MTTWGDDAIAQVLTGGTATVVTEVDGDGRWHNAMATWRAGAGALSISNRGKEKRGGRRVGWAGENRRREVSLT
jgi:hypothetical protein